MSIQLFVPKFRVDETLAEIRECLERGWTGMGFKTVEVEKRWCEFTGLPHAHFLSSATAGLHLALEVFKREFGWADGDEVITTPLTFVSSNHAILYANLSPTFVDIDEYLCLDPAEVRRAVTPRTRAVMFVGLGGNVGQLREMKKLCSELNLKLILDAAHLAGARLDDRDPGVFADCSVYSYQAVKNMPTADSGMICFAEASHDAIARKMSWLGINADTYSRSIASTAAGQGGVKAAPYKWYYDVEYVGWKYNGNAVMAAMALVSLRYLAEDNARRREIAAKYNQILSPHNHIQRVPMADNSVPAHHLYQILVHGRDIVVSELNNLGVNVGVHYRDNTNYPMYSFAAGTCPKAHDASERILSLPMHMGLTNEDVAEVCAAVLEVTDRHRA
jgi:dTDP-4-amino-4,6-dideoxygalactose transaminase